jgi:hypothetical protein
MRAIPIPVPAAATSVGTASAFEKRTETRIATVWMDRKTPALRETIGRTAEAEAWTPVRMG